MRDFIEENKSAVVVIGGILALFVVFELFRKSPSIEDFRNALKKNGVVVETFSGAELKEMNSIVISGKGGAFIFGMVVRAVVYAKGALTEKQALERADVAGQETATLRTDGVLILVWRYPYAWQANANLAVEDLIYKKDMASNLGAFCREAGHEKRISCSKFKSFVHENFFISISDVKEKVVLNGGQVVNYVPLEAGKVQHVHDVITRVRF